jgi:chitinase
MRTKTNATIHAAVTFAGAATFAAFAALTAFAAGTVQAKEIVGYYPAWQWYDREHMVRPATLPYDKLTVINYAFFKPKPDGTLEGTDSWADDNILKGDMDWSANTYKPGTGLVDVAHAHGVKVMVSIGGWTLSDLFPAIAADAGLRENFANACVKAIVDYGFDGIDIDWEYPGFAEHKGTPADKANFTLFLQAIRAKLDAHGAGKKHYLLSAAMPAGPDRVADIEVEKVGALLDFLNVMTYDFFGAWDPITGHNSPLFSQSQGDPAFSLDAAFRLYHETHGIAADKLNVGVAFYGRSFKGGALFGPQQGADASTFSADEGSPMYYNVVKAMAGGKYQRYWDDVSKVPYAIDKAGNSFISYDDAQSVALKAEYVKSKGARGVIIWEITGDAMDDGSHPLLSQLGSAFGIAQSQGTAIAPIPDKAPSRGSHPVQASLRGGKLALDFGASATDIPVRVALRDSRGRSVQTWEHPSMRGGRVELDAGEGFASAKGPGLFLIEVHFADGGMTAAKLAYSLP